MRCARHADALFNRHRARARHRREAREAASGWAIPAAIVYCESGGRNEPPNSAGAAGYYQITEWVGKGGSPPDDASQHSKAEQDRMARGLYAAEGTRPWVSSESCWGGRV